MTVLSEDKSLHEQLKYWLISLGKSLKNKRGKPYYKAWSGDSKSLIIRFGKRHDSYYPDVAWKHRDEICAFEIAFTEGWREIAGEICLASMVEDCVKIFITTYLPEGDASFYERRWKEYVSMIGEKVGLKYGAEVLFIPYDIYKENKIDDIKKVILARLEDRKWVW